MEPFKQDSEFTPVIFRKARKKYGGEVIALFPAEPWSNAYDCACYVHVGQHGAADPHHVINTSRLATPAEYADLKRELESAPYGYRLKLYTRLQRSFMAMRRATLARMR